MEEKSTFDVVWGSWIAGVLMAFIWNPPLELIVPVNIITLSVGLLMGIWWSNREPEREPTDLLPAALYFGAIPFTVTVALVSAILPASWAVTIAAVGASLFAGPLASIGVLGVLVVKQKLGDDQEWHATPARLPAI